MDNEIVFQWELSTGGLLGVAAAAIAVLLLLIIAFRIHAFVALVLVSLLTALATGITPANIVPVMLSGFGGTLASVALLVGLGAMLGRLLEASGGAQRLTDNLIQVFGEKRAPLAVSVASLLMGFPIFFDAGLVLMLPIIYAVARRLSMPFLSIAFPSVLAFLSMHIFVPPHPGPVTAVDLFGADQGLMVIWGLVFVIVTWAVAALFSQPLTKSMSVPVPEILGSKRENEMTKKFESNPSPMVVVFLLVLPLALIAFNTVLNTFATAGLVDGENQTVQTLRMIGETPVALLITVIIAVFILGVGRGKSGKLTELVTDSALGPVCSVILVTGAGGMFGGVLRSSGIGDAIAAAMDAMHLPIVVATFLVAAVVRVAQGSATVSLTTAAALMQPAILSGDYNSLQLVALVAAAAGGSSVVSHVNDSGFWLVSRFFGLSTAQTLRTWTVLTTIVGCMGFVLALAMFSVASMV